MEFNELLPSFSGFKGLGEYCLSCYEVTCTMEQISLIIVPVATMGHFSP